MVGIIWGRVHVKSIYMNVLGVGGVWGGGRVVVGRAQGGVGRARPCREGASHICPW